MKDTRKIIYFEDELNDEFSITEITPKKIDENYDYFHDSLWGRFKHFLAYRIFATPIAFFYTKFKFSHKVINKKVLKPYKKTGYFFYGNHTQDIGDAFMPSMINFPKRNYCIVHPNNVSMPYLGRINPYLGALPLPDDMVAAKNFTKVIKKRISENHCVVIYPEAHIWPYYTKIRPFTDKSFTYPVKFKTPTFCFTNTYQKKKHGVRIVTYVDGPFFPDPNLSLSEQKTNLRNQVYDAMVKRSLNSNVEVIKYERKEA